MLLGGIGASSVVSMGMRIYLKDDFSGPASHIKSNFDQLRGQIDQYRDGLRMAQRTYGMMAMAGGLALNGLAGWVREGAQFSYIIEGVGAVTEATTHELKGLYDLANKLGRETMFMPEDIASGMRFMGMAGMNAVQVMGNIEAAVNLAGATMSELGGKGGAADIMTNVMKGFGYGVEKAAQTADILTLATVRANINLFDLGEAIKYSVATAKDLGQELPTIAAMAMSLGNVGIQGTMAGTAIENMFRYLAKGLGEFKTSRQAKAWDLIGLSPKDVLTANDSLRPMVEILEAMKNNLAQMGEVKKQDILMQIFGVRGKRAGSAFIRNVDEVKDFINLLSNNSAGASISIMSDMMDTLQGDIFRVVSSFKSFKVEFSKSMEPVIRPMLSMLKSLLDVIVNFLATPMGKVVAPLMVGLIALKTAGWAFKATLATLMLTVGRFGAQWAAVSTGIRAQFKLMTTDALRYIGVIRAGGRWDPAMYGQYRTGQYYRRGPGGGAIPMRRNFQPGLAGMMGISRLGSSIFGRLLGFMAGPWGLALAFGLPLAIQGLTHVLTKQKRAIEENTQKLKESIEQEGVSRTISSEFFSPNEVYLKMRDKSLEEIRIGYMKVVEELRKMGSEGAIWASQKTPIQIYIDGIEYMRRTHNALEPVKVVIDKKIR